MVTLAGVGVGCKRSDAATAAQGQELFTNTCARCHGAAGTGGLPLYAGGPSPRNFHDVDFQNSRTDEQLKQTIKNGKGSGMPAFGTTFDDAQLTALVEQIRLFGKQKAVAPVGPASSEEKKER
jgi:cytochrome c oxidase cbb3-type subunit 3